MIGDSSRKITAILLCLLLAACGGGSDTSGATGSSTANGDGAAANTPGSTDSSGSGSSGGSAGSSGGTTGTTGGTTGSTADTSAFTYDETARFNGPTDIKADTAGNLYVLDMGNKAIRRIAADGAVSTLPVALSEPQAIEIDTAGNLYVIDAGVLYKVTPTGNLDALLSDALSSILTTDRQGNLYVSTAGDPPVIRRISASGDVTMLPNQTFGSGRHRGVVVDDAGNMYVGSYGSERSIGSILKIAPDGTQTVFATGDFADIGNMAFDSQGNLFIAQFQELIPGMDCAEFNSCYLGGTDQMIRKIDANGTVSTVLSGPPGGSIGDAAYDTTFGRFHLAVGADGNVYATYERKQAVYKVTQAGATSLIAGKPGEAGSSD
jgi:sugar lactone lactonase YvrE